VFLRSFEAGLLENTIERANPHVHSELSGNSVPKLPMTALRPDVEPPVLLEEPDDVTDLHGARSTERCLTSALSEARLRRRQSKLIYPEAAYPSYLTEATRRALAPMRC
jgi:hypothetical protein